MASPVRDYGRRLSGIAEYLHADNTVLRKENAEMKGMLNTRTKRASGKRVVLKGKFIVTTEPIHQSLANAERKTKKRSSKGKQKKNKLPSEQDKMEVVKVLEVFETEEHEMQDCIAVQ